MKLNSKKFSAFLLICFFALGAFSFVNPSFYSTEPEFEKNITHLKTADTNLKVAVLDSTVNPSYAVGVDHNDYISIYNALIANGIDTIIITNADILSDILLSVDVLVLVDNWPSDAASVVVRDWALKGGGILSFDGSIALLNWAGLLPPEASTTNGNGVYWNYAAPDQGKVINDGHPVMNGYTYGDIVNGTSGDSQYFSDEIMKTSAGPYYTPLVKEDLGSNYDLVVALDSPYCGRVVHIWDQFHWNTTTNRQMILNSINWIREKFVDVPQTIVINELYTGDPDYIELYNYGSSINMSGWYMDFYYNDAFLQNYSFPTGWMFNSHQVVTMYETAGTDTSTDLYMNDALPWTSGAIAVGLFDDQGANVDWFQTFDHNGSFPIDALWINDTLLDTDNHNYVYRIKDLDTNRASDWKISTSGTIGSLNPDQKGHFFNFPTITGPIAIFQDAYPWNYNSTDIILEMYGISYTIYDSTDFGAIDISPYQKVIISSDQPQSFYNRLSGNVSWFESYVANGGILEIHAADHGWNSGHWDGVLSMPGGLNHTYSSIDTLDINLPQHPIILNPHPANDTGIDNWDASSHGYFDVYPSDCSEILTDTGTSNPILIEFKFGNGYIIASLQTFEFAYLYDSPYSPGSVIYENILLYDPSAYYFSDTLNVETPNSLTSLQTGSSDYIEWTTAGNISYVKIELFRAGVFEMEISANTTTDGEFYWTFPLSLIDSTQYQIKITDLSNPYTYDYSDYFEIYNPTITITSPDSSSSWIRGTEHFLNWTSTGTLADVKIELFLNGTFVLEIAASTPNDGEFTWNIPSNLTTSTLYQIKISDATNSIVYDYSDNFTIRRPTSPDNTVLIIVIIVIIAGVAVAVTVVVVIKKRKPKI
ncbi:MAG: Ser-Thr-rich GPI-anchored membrane family protein [Promethearchaeota archaeon]